MIWLLLILKHFYVDFCIQDRYEYSNKGIYGHMGGIKHALKHAAYTAVALAICNYAGQDFILTKVILLEFVIHYHIDWLKVNICNKFNLKPESSEIYWVVLGLDQMLHYLTYWFIIEVML